jgi:hypothetical protein
MAITEAMGLMFNHITELVQIIQSEITGVRIPTLIHTQDKQALNITTTTTQITISTITLITFNREEQVITDGKLNSNL